MDEINVILISSVRPENSFSAASVDVPASGQSERHSTAHFARWNITRLSTAVSLQDCSAANANASATVGRRRRYLMPHHGTVGRALPCARGTRTVLLTLAYRSGCWVRAAYARQHRLPLIVRFDDWWPDIAEVHKPVRKQLEQRFLEPIDLAD